MKKRIIIPAALAVIFVLGLNCGAWGGTSPRAEQSERWPLWRREVIPEYPPHCVETNSDGSLMYTGQLAGHVEIFEYDNNRTFAKVITRDTDIYVPDSCSITRDDRTLWVIGRINNTPKAYLQCVEAVEPYSVDNLIPLKGEVEGQIPRFLHTDICFDPRPQSVKAFVTLTDGSRGYVAQINQVNHEIEDEIFIDGCEPNRVDFAGPTFLVVSGRNSGNLFILDTESGNILSSVVHVCDEGISDILVPADDPEHAYVLGETGYLYYVNLRTGLLEDTVRLGSDNSPSSRMELGGPGNRRLFCSVSPNWSIKILDIDTNSVIGVIRVETMPYQIAANPSYVATFNESPHRLYMSSAR